MVTIRSVRDISDRKGIVGPENTYFMATFKRIAYDKKSNISQYSMINKKGVAGHLKEIGTDKNSIVEANNYPFGRQNVKLPTKYLNKLSEKKQDWLSFPMNVNDPKMVIEGIITTPPGVDIAVERVTHASLKDLYSNFNYIKFGVSNKAELQQLFADKLGYKNWAEFANDTRHAGFMKKGARLQFFDATIVRIAPAQTSTKNNETEAPVTQSLSSLKAKFNNNECL